MSRPARIPRARVPSPIASSAARIARRRRRTLPHTTPASVATPIAPTDCTRPRPTFGVRPPHGVGHTRHSRAATLLQIAASIPPAPPTWPRRAMSMPQRSSAWGLYGPCEASYQSRRRRRECRPGLTTQLPQARLIRNRPSLRSCGLDPRPERQGKRAVSAARS